MKRRHFLGAASASVLFPGNLQLRNAALASVLPAWDQDCIDQRFGRAPLYPTFIAAIATLDPDHVVRNVRIAQCFLGCLAVWLIRSPRGKQVTGTVDASS